MSGKDTATATQHWTWFAEFCRYERLTGGPDPHMKAVLWLSRSLPFVERLWRVLLYVGVYNVPSAEAIWRHWSGARYLAEPEALEPWLTEHWKGLRLRRERRTVKSPAKLAAYCTGYFDTLTEFSQFQSFDDAWTFALSLPHVGRYAATKLTECWHQLGLTTPVQDIRARGGWSPRATLRMLNPDLNHDEYDDTQVQQAENLARLAHARLRLEFGISLSFFEFEVMLCEYKASYSSKRQYPGRSLDSELSYEAAIRPYWQIAETEHFQARRQLSPAWALGELQGWDGVRDELGHVLSQHGYTWSDSLYQYTATTDFANPVRRRQAIRR